MDFKDDLPTIHFVGLCKMRPAGIPADFTKDPFYFLTEADLPKADRGKEDKEKLKPALRRVISYIAFLGVSRIYCIAQLFTVEGVIGRIMGKDV